MTQDVGSYDYGKEFRDELEGLLDRTTLTLLIESLSVVASEKAEHLRENWQDESAAKAWDVATRYLDRVAWAHAIVGVS